MAGHIFKVSLPNPFMKSIRNLCGGTVQLIFIEKEEEEEKCGKRCSGPHYEWMEE